uniref:MYND-type domain-containing protein n=1 Tax=Panagrolaimus sp. ES5 TaxID=591445 RepID=A0AC34GWP7_9BILA
MYELKKTENELGVVKDYSKAAEWFQKAIKNGYDVAKATLFFKDPLLEKVKLDPTRKLLLLKNREAFFGVVEKCGTTKPDYLGQFQHNFDPSKWSSLKKITLKGMNPTKNGVYSECYLEARIIDWPVFRAPKLRALIEDENGDNQSDRYIITILNDAKANVECHFCGKDAKILRYSGCMMAKYCSTECQKIDWREFNHKKVCKQLQVFHTVM